MLVDMGSSADILYLGAYDRLGLLRNLLKPACTPLTGFTWHSIYPVGIVDLDFTLGEAPRTLTIRASFTIVDIFDPSYNGLTGRPILIGLRAIVSPLHLKIKFPTTGRVGEVSGHEKRARVCYKLFVPRGSSLKEPTKQKRHKRNPPWIMKKTHTLAAQDNSPQERKSLKKGSPYEELEVVSLSEQQPEKTLKIGTQLNPDHRNLLIKLLQRYEDVFAWAPRTCLGWMPTSLCTDCTWIQPICL
ncbi:hypothetical protein LIER_23213 [Lithospermum erythrorhizon]|uniref:Uncharacterized protein n=1 Tax=Lithospermum erythrorhizon TaxID=34254 RepID=A0AAV3QWU2_LITER